ncbi:MAG: NADH-quinone oxidoreductase subunit G [Streptosporangiales bacterium]|nr:NADH-quinone oxidoreductase subunit G [Streptosporangiales bacterium]
MTVTTGKAGPPAERPADMVTVTIDGTTLDVPKGMLIIRAAEMIGVAIPRFCDHPLLEPVGACRQCLVEVTDMGNGRGMPKPAASCTTTCMDGMVVQTHESSAVAEKAQRGVMELLLMNHPLDCPVCDKGGECPLQNQAMSNGQGESRFHDVKRTYPKPIAISAEVLLDRERCVLCARCTRFSEQIAGDPFIELLERGALEQVGVFEEKPFDSYFSGNTTQICPVGALTSTSYRFRSRPFDLVSTPSTCEHCASGCSQRTDHRRGTVMRRLAGNDQDVNEEWNCDKGRWAFHSDSLPDRLQTPLVRDEDGKFVPASWQEALHIAAEGLAKARAKAGVLTGGRLPLEDAYGYAKFARAALATNNVDMRARPHSAEEADFLAAQVAGTGLGVTYADLEQAPAVVLAGFEMEEESPIVFLRLRKAAREGRTSVYSLAPYETRGLKKAFGTLVQTAPGTEPEVLDALVLGGTDAGLDEVGVAAAEALRSDGAVLLVGERLAAVPGALSAAARLAHATGARLAWIPRRAGERGAVEAGALPNLLPGGRPVDDPEARVQVSRTWAVRDLPIGAGKDTAAILAAARSGELEALVVAGVDPADLPDPAEALAALEHTPFVVSLETRASTVTDRADVVLPVAATSEKPGTFVDWEGRERPFDAVFAQRASMSDLQALNALADQMDIHLGLPDAATAQHEMRQLGVWAGPRPEAPAASAAAKPRPEPGQAALATWHLLLDAGRLQDGEPYLAGTAPAAHARVSAVTAAEAGVADGDKLTVATEHGSITVPLVVTEMPDRVVWLPTNSPGCAVRSELRADAGDVVTLSAGGGRR